VKDSLTETDLGWSPRGAAGRAPPSGVAVEHAGVRGDTVFSELTLAKAGWKLIPNALAHTGPGYGRGGGGGGPRKPTERTERGTHASAVTLTGGSGRPPRIPLGPVGCDVVPHTDAGRRGEIVPGRHPRTYHGHRAGGGCGSRRTYAGTGARPSLPPAFLSGLVIQASSPFPSRARRAQCARATTRP
jgi:hypothetical protein